jgi:hypothetical protein
MLQKYITFFLGIWLVLSGMIVQLQGAFNFTFVGIATAIFGFWVFKNWLRWFNGILGLWIFLSGGVLNLTFSWNFIMSGIVLIVLGFWHSMLPNYSMKLPPEWKNQSILED